MLKVSVIVPIYNAMNVLDKTIPSILNQSYKNIEILLVDNNSTDKSFEYIKSLQQKDDRIIALTEKKQGPNNARKTGLLNSTGDYIMFCDADDYLKEDAISNFINEIDKSKADVVIGNYIEITPERDIIKRKKGVFFKEVDYNLKQEKEILFIKPALWNKIFRKDLIEEDFFIKSTIGEDMVITLESLMLSNNIKYIDEDIYEYVISEEGLSNSVSAKSILDILVTVKGLKEISKKYSVYEEYKDEIEYISFTHVIYKMLRTVVMKSDEERKEVYSILNKYLEENNKYKKNKYYKSKIHYRLANFLLTTKWIYNLKIIRILLKQIFTNKKIFTIFKKLDV